MFAVLHGILGLAAIVGVAVIFCENRKEIRWRTVAAAFGLQAVLAVVLLKFPGTRQVFFCSTPSLKRWLRRLKPEPPSCSAIYAAGRRHRSRSFPGPARIFSRFGVFPSFWWPWSNWSTSDWDGCRTSVSSR